MKLVTNKGRKERIEWKVYKRNERTYVRILQTECLTIYTLLGKMGYKRWGRIADKYWTLLDLFFGSIEQSNSEITVDV